MTQRTDIEFVLDVWLADGPTAVPDRVFDEAVAAVYRVPQRSPWRLRRRNLKVSTRLLATAAAIALIVAGVYAFSPISQVGPSPSPSIQPRPTATPDPVSCLVDGTPVEACHGTMAAGTYQLRSPLVPFSVTVPDGWQNPMNILGGAMFEHQDGPSAAAIYVWPDPVVADHSACRRAPDATFGRRLVDLVEFLTSHPGLTVTNRTAVTLGGLSGEAMRIVRSDAEAPPCGTAASLFVHDTSITDGFWWDLAPGITMNVWLLEAGDGHTVLVNAQAPSDEVDAFMTAATPVIESMRFTRLAECVDSSACLGLLAAGTYASTVMEVPLTFTVPDGWKNDWDVPLGYALVPADSDEPSGPGIFIFLDVYASNQAACSRAPATGVGRASADLMAWLGSLPDLSISTPEAVTVGGLSGTRVDVTVASGGPVCGSGDYQLWVSDYQPLWWGLAPGETTRHYLLDLPGRHNVLIVVPGPEPEFDALVATAEAVIESFEFRP